MEAKFYILQYYAPKSNAGKNNDGLANIFYANINGEDKIWLGYPERATRYKTIGDAMKVATKLSDKVKGVYFKAIPIYTEDIFNKK